MRDQTRPAVGFRPAARCPRTIALWALRTWLDSWLGIGQVAVGMHRQGFDLQLTERDDRGWRIEVARKYELMPWTHSLH